jgi:UDP-N-acetylglucosamine transferase subunit ALG13
VLGPGHPLGDPLVLVTVGTDAFQFNRLMSWVDAWAERPHRPRARLVVQSGASTPPRHVPSRPFLSHPEYRSVLERAAVVVCHGSGPSALEALAQGTIPIVVPRRRALREAVDDHQVAFASRLARDGHALVADSAEQLHLLLDQGLGKSRPFRAAPGTVDTSRVIERFDQLTRSLPRLRPAAAAPGGRVRVVFIAGAGRSGSTLLERMLGQVEGCCSVGELVHLWERGLAENNRCGCGEAFHSCGFWSAVGEEAFGGWDTLNPTDVLGLKRRVDRHRYIPLLAAPRASHEYGERLGRFALLLERLYGAIARVSGCDLIIDSSKSSSYVMILRRVAGIDLRLLHMTRDSRGVAYSATKRVLRPEVTDRHQYMPTYGPTRSAVDWTVYNLLFEAVGATGVPSIHLRYESLLRDPRRQLRRVLRFGGMTIPPDALGFLGNGSVELGVNHTVSGNPMRFRSGTVSLRLDDEWRTQLQRRDLAGVTAVTAPLLRRYGYKLGART